MTWPHFLLIIQLLALAVQFHFGRKTILMWKRADAECAKEYQALAALQDQLLAERLRLLSAKPGAPGGEQAN